MQFPLELDSVLPWAIQSGTWPPLQTIQFPLELNSALPATFQGDSETSYFLGHLEAPILGVRTVTPFQAANIQIPQVWSY